MNPPSFTGLSIAEDPKNFIEELKKVFDVMHVTDISKERRAAMLIGYMDVSRMMVYVQQQRQKGSATSSASAPVPRNRGEYNGQNSQNFRTRPALSQGSVAQRGNWAHACAKCGTNHPGKYCEGQTSCFKCGQEGYFLKECPKNMQGSKNQGNRAQSS
ncbi:uncharacterized protein LOC125856103 [Solanum stenotomum]|uniref:uncharacterized protein LOC125856103 n=1 Tax=Solanum stenotomum TaxID=172797 RepID=UPI0020D0A5B1|nr:uncharacterized protein LOC125856103 [Solanum stenotomum]